MASGTDLLTSANPVFDVYVFYSVILIIKMFLMALLTGFQRFRKKVFISPEDTVLGQGEVKYDDPDIERIRRAHLNDLENIPIFLISGLLFVLSNPNETLATWLFRLYAIARIIHTIVYSLYVVRQPARSIFFATGVMINIIMCVLTVIKFFHL